MPDEASFPPPGFTAVLLFDDPTPNAVIVSRIARRMFEIAANHTDLGKEEGNDFLDLVILIARKMVSVWKHLQAYHAEERRLIAKVEENPAYIEYSQNLFEEFDVFAVQIKSALDHLAQVMRPILGRSWTMYTFGNKGEAVLRALKCNAGKKHQGRVRSMEHFVFSDQHKAWLEAIIDSRDRMNHCQAGGLKIDKFTVCGSPDGSIHVPLWSNEQELGKAMDGIWAHFFHFVEDFLAIALHFRMPEDKFSIFKKPVELPSPSSPWHILRRADADEMIRRHGATPI